MHTMQSTVYRVMDTKTITGQLQKRIISLTVLL